ncbi:MAG: DUF4282 domain-containing protein [Phycisphaeraceae bacterium]
MVTNQHKSWRLNSGSLLTIFDLGFNQYFTVAVIEFLYALYLLFSTVAAIIGIICVFFYEFTFTNIIIRPEQVVYGKLFPVIDILLTWALAIVFTRIACEIVTIAFRIASDLNDIRLRLHSTESTQPITPAKAQG